jgi:uncharacterized membrane protein YhfC
MDILYLTHPMNGILMFILPIAVGFFLVSKFKLGWGLWWAGGTTFIISQIAHIPFNLIILNPLIVKITNFMPSELRAILFTSVLLGLSAGIFEETARFVAYRGWRKDARSWAHAVLFGAGHGGLEAILLGLLVLFTFVQMITLRNANLLAIVPEHNLSLVKQQIDVYWSVPWHLSLFGALERAFVIPFHISAAVLVVQTFKRHQIRWLLIAILWHTFVDAIGVSAAQLWGVYAAEGILALIAIMSIGIILAFREPYQTTIDELPLKPDAARKFAIPIYLKII